MKKRRYYSPISQKFLESLLIEKIPQEIPYRPILGTVEKSVNIQQIVKDNYKLACQCTGRKQCYKYECKPLMYSNMPDKVIGFMNVDGNKLLGGVEWYPSLYVPYDIPKGDDIAFITCVYISDDYFDYKTAPLKALEQYLAKLYNKVIVICDEVGVFPNGDLTFFIRNGYQDEKVIFEDEYCRLHLLSKELSSF